ncbi:2-C-methyl-D-erythritol 4-phosphate cytidylyltransferase [Candidatus Poribacteria bacterium]|nr:MAG: 2-C-methyl-D-erythritol 4-phosphate cytidylyltransferase [Candidatus Poribacteria bacterium]
MNSKVGTLIPAAGKGSRMAHSLKKPYLKLAKKPILAHTIQRFEQNTAVDTIFVIVDETDFNACRKTVLEPYPFTKVQELVAGGETRQKSVYNGVCALSADVDFVIVHDGVRPFVTDETIFDCLTAADECGAAVAAVPVKDTIKVANENCFISETPEREKLWAVQTPQVFRKSVLEEAHQIAQERQLTGTDDAALVEQLGFPVKLVMGSYANLKITTPVDLRVAEVLLSDPTLW